MTRERPRPSPDALLAQATRAGRGRLKILLGAAPGVGKTYEMLSEGAQRKRAGVDVVVLGGHHVVVDGCVRAPGGPLVEQPADVRGDLGAALDRERASLAEVVLHVDDDQRSLHAPTIVTLSRSAPGAR